MPQKLIAVLPGPRKQTCTPVSETERREVARSIRTLHRLLKGVRTGLRHGIPELRRPEVNIVNAKQIHVLDVPSKRRSPHAEVQIRRIDTRKTLGRCWK